MYLFGITMNSLPIYNFNSIKQFEELNKCLYHEYKLSLKD